MKRIAEKLEQTLNDFADVRFMDKDDCIEFLAEANEANGTDDTFEEIFDVSLPEDGEIVAYVVPSNGEGRAFLIWRDFDFRDVVEYATDGDFTFADGMIQAN